MNGKKSFKMLPVLLFGMALGACGPQVDPVDPNPDPGPGETVKYTVTFKNGETVLQSGEVEEGQTASYTGATPTKEATEDSYFVFDGWDKSLTDPITGNTEFNAVFKEFAKKLVIDTFDSYADDEAISDAWKVEQYKTNGWSDETEAAIRIGHLVKDGSAKSAMIYVPMNTNAYRFSKDITVPTKSVKGLRFSLKTEAYAAVTVRFEGSINIPGSGATSFYVDTKIDSVGTNAWTDYVLPFDSSWVVWRGTAAEKTLGEICGAYNIAIEDVAKLVNKIEFIISGYDNVGGRKYYNFLDNIAFVSEENLAKDVDQEINLEKVYTVEGNGDIVKFTTGANAKIETLTRENNIAIPGSTTLDGDLLTFKSADNGASFTYTAKLKNGGKKLVKEGTPTGTYAQVGGLIESFDAVTVLEDFNSYPVTGKLAQQADLSDGVGIGQAWYGDYYKGSDSSPVGGNGWSLMGGDGTQLKIKNDGTKLDGTNYACMKRGQAGAMRFLSMDLAKGTADKNDIRGKTLSFWYKTKTGTISAKVRAYFSTQMNASNQTSNWKGSDSVSLTHSDEWQHMEVALDSTIVYHGLCFLLNAASSDDFLYIDNIEIYNANPYAKYVAPAAPATIDANVQYITTVNSNPAILTTGAEGACKLEVPGSMSETGTYAVADGVVTFTFGSNLTYVGAIDETTGNIALTSATGTYASYFTQGFKKGQMLDNMESYSEAGVMYSQANAATSRSGARGAYYCDYYSGNGSSPVGGNGWSLMGGSGDQLDLVKTGGHSGNNYIKIKSSTAGNMRYMNWGLYDGTAQAITGASYVAMWVKNLSADAVSLKGYAYYQQKVEPSTQQLNRTDIAQVSLAANGDWQLVITPLKADTTYYGVALFAVQGNATRWIAVDDICFF